MTAPITFEPVDFPRERFDAEWQTHLAAHIRLAGMTCSKTKEELKAGVAKEPVAFMNLLETLTTWEKDLIVYHSLVETAIARILIVAQ